jgi:hypothetical protein
VEYLEIQKKGEELLMVFIFSIASLIFNRSKPKQVVVT